MLTGLYPSRGAFKDTLSAPQTSLSEKIEPRCRNVETEAYITRLSCRNRACHFLTPAPLRLLPVVHPVLPPTSGGLGAQSESLHVMTLGDLRRSRGLGEGEPCNPCFPRPPVYGPTNVSKEPSLPHRRKKSFDSNFRLNTLAVPLGFGL